MGRRPGATPRRRINLYIDEHVLAQLALHYFDPARGKPKFGVMSDIVNTALAEHIEKLKEKQNV